MNSRFEGGLLGLIVVNILAGLITICTFGLGAPWAMCMKYKWQIKNTVVEGRRLKFVGSGSSLFESNIFSFFTFKIDVDTSIILFPPLIWLKRICPHLKWEPSPF